MAGRHIYTQATPPPGHTNPEYNFAAPPSQYTSLFPEPQIESQPPFRQPGAVDLCPPQPTPPAEPYEFENRVSPADPPPKTQMSRDTPFHQPSPLTQAQMPLLADAPSSAPVYRQPAPKEGMMVMPGSGKLNAKNLPLDGTGRRPWSNGTCSCFGDCSTFCLACCCPCMVYGQNKRRYEHLKDHGIPDPEAGGSCGGDCWVHCLLTSFTGFGWILQIPLRGSVRNRYSIQGGTFGDCCSSFWCNPCALTQESREIELEEKSVMPAAQRGGVYGQQQHF